MFVFESDVKAAQEILERKAALCMDDFVRITTNMERMNGRIKLANQSRPADQQIELFNLEMSISDIRDVEKVKLVGKITGPGGFAAAIAVGGAVAISAFGFACTLAATNGLSGGAIITNALAWLGGGSIASGGGGMVAGLASLGGIAIGAAALVGIGMSAYNMSVNKTNVARINQGILSITTMHQEILQLNVEMNHWFDCNLRYFVLE